MSRKSWRAKISPPVKSSHRVPSSASSSRRGRARSTDIHLQKEATPERKREIFRTLAQDPEVLSDVTTEAVARTALNFAGKEWGFWEYGRFLEVLDHIGAATLTETGSEATFHALRLARTVTGRRHVVKFQGCYHGWHDAVAMNVISPAERMGGRDPHESHRAATTLEEMEAAGETVGSFEVT